jgi:hypothetical protein
MTKRKLKKKLRKCQKVRDEWCKEYTKIRDKLAAIRDIMQYGGE